MAIQRHAYLEQIADEFGGTELRHYGVRGMKWGVRKRRSSSTESSESSDPQPVTVRQNPRTKRLETSGGSGHKPSEDALTAAAVRQKARASGAQSLSNKEMETLVKRMNLEASYAKAMAASAPPKGKGRQLLQNVVKGEMEAAFKGKKGPVANFVGIIIQGGAKAAAKNKAKKAASKTAAKSATLVTSKVLVGKVVN